MKTDMTLLEKEYNKYFSDHSNLTKKFVLDDKLNKILKYVGSNKKALDVGCATGYTSYFCMKKNNSVVGIDFLIDGIKIAKNKGIDARQCNIELDDFPLRREEEFDVVIFSEVIEHLIDPIKVLNKIHKALKDRGVLIVSTPNMAYIQYRLELLFGKIPDFCEFRDRFKERPYNFQHKTLFNYQTLSETLKKAGFIIKKRDSHRCYKNKFERAVSFLENVFPNLFIKNLILICEKDKKHDESTHRLYK